MTQAATSVDVDDVQSAALHPRPAPYVGRFVLIRVDDPDAGRTLLRRLIPSVKGGVPAAAEDAWVAVAFTYQGLRALGLPQESLDSFPAAFRQGMAARAEAIGDTGPNAPEHWEAPLGGPGVHIAVSALAPDTARLERVLERARTALATTPGVTVIWRQEVHQLPTGRTSLGFRDGISHPAIEGIPTPNSDPNPHETPVKPGEFILGYPDETGNLPPMPRPDVLGRNGTYVAIRKLRTDVAAWRRYLRDHSTGPEDEELLAAKLVGRWPSGAPLELAPEHDDPALAADPHRNNDFTYREHDDRGYRCPATAHIRRVNPRDATVVGDARLHRVIRRGTSYGPPLPGGVLDDDGADRGLVGVFICAHLERQFEFIKAEWVNDGNFIGYPGERDPVAGHHGGTGTVTIPARPVRRRLQDLPSFVTTRGGEYCFLPGLRALHWLADLSPRP